MWDWRLEGRSNGALTAAGTDPSGRLVAATACEFAQISQRALQFWKQEWFQTLMRPHGSAAIPAMVAGCYRAKPHWNATVNRMSATVLECVGAA